ITALPLEIKAGAELAALPRRGPLLRGRHHRQSHQTRDQKSFHESFPFSVPFFVPTRPPEQSWSEHLTIADNLRNIPGKNGGWGQEQLRRDVFQCIVAPTAFRGPIA